jgi:hypothetical protein
MDGRIPAILLRQDTASKHKAVEKRTDLEKFIVGLYWHGTNAVCLVGNAQGKALAC